MSNRFFPSYPDYLVTSKYGMRTHPVTKIKKMHNGIDLVATDDGKTGYTDHIMAHTGGTVDAVGFGVSAGYYVKIRVSSDTVMVYYHMKSKSTLEVGQTVRKGDIIGYMGKTGAVTGAHLHWGIKKGDNWIDPTPYLDKDYTADKTFTLTHRVLRRGCKGEDVRALQALLVGYGYPIAVDGSYGAKTENAVICYQEDTSGVLDPDGKAGPKTQAHMLGLE